MRALVAVLVLCCSVAAYGMQMIGFGAEDYATIGYVNSGSQEGNADPLSYELTWEPAEGNLLVAAIAGWYGTDRIVGVSDNNGNTWAPATSLYTSTDQAHDTKIYYTVVETGKGGTMTVSVDMTEASDVAVVVAEYTNIDPTPSILQNGAGGNSTNPSPGALSPTGNHLYVAVLSHTINEAPTGAWTQVQEVRGSYVYVAYQHLLNQSGSNTGSWTLATGQWSAATASFEGATE